MFENLVTQQDYRLRERPLMMSYFMGEGEGGSKMTPKYRTLDGKNRTLGGEGGGEVQK